MFLRVLVKPFFSSTFRCELDTLLVLEAGLRSLVTGPDGSLPSVTSTALEGPGRSRYLPSKPSEHHLSFGSFFIGFPVSFSAWEWDPDSVLHEEEWKNDTLFSLSSRASAGFCDFRFSLPFLRAPAFERLSAPFHLSGCSTSR